MIKARYFLIAGLSLGSGCASLHHEKQSEVTPATVAEIQPDIGDYTLSPYVTWETPPLPITDNALSLSIENAVFLALERNSELRIQTLNPIRTGAFELIESGVFRPELYGSLEFQEEESVETSRATGEEYSVVGSDRDSELGIQQTLATGTEIELGVTQTRSISNRTDEQQEARVGLTVTQSLLNGFGPAVNLASLRQAKLDTLASVYELRGYAESFVAEVETAYWRYVMAQQEISIFERSLEFARRELDEVEQRINVGSLSQADGAIYRAEVAVRESALIDSRADLEERRLRLCRLLNASEEQSLRLTIVSVSQPDSDFSELGDLDQRIELALQMRPDLNEARLQLANDRLSTVVTKNGLLPRLDLFITLGKTGYSDTFYGSFENLDDKSYDAAVGIEFSKYLGDKAAKGRHLIARADREQSALSLGNLEQIVRLDVNLALNELDRTRKQAITQAEIRTHRNEIVISEEEKLQVGATTALQVAQAKRDLLEAEIQEVEALIDYRIALVDLYLVEGSLLERRGISIPGQ